MKTIELTEKMSAAEFLAFERAADTKHEFINGQVIDMAGGSRVHFYIVSNLLFYLRLINSRQENYNYGAGDMRVFNPLTEGYFYPDVIGLEGNGLYQDSNADVLLNPSVIVEVLSP